MAGFHKFGKWSTRIVGWVAALIAIIVRSALYRAVVPFLTDVVRALWVCRVALFSVIIGILVMWIAPQARDLFFETVNFADAGQYIQLFTGPDYNVYNKMLESLGFALWFCIAILLFWAIPLHGAARWSLDGLAQPPQTLLGRKTARLIKQHQPIDKRIVKWTPRILGLATFAAIEIGILQAFPQQFNDQLVPVAKDARYQLYILAGVMVLGAILFYIYTRTRYWIFNRFIGRPTGRSVALTRGDRVRVTGGSGVTLLQVISFICVVLVTGLLGWFICQPQTFYFESRVILVPIVLGTWVPILSFLTWLSYPLRLPLLVMMIGFITFYQVGHEGHPVRPFVNKDGAMSHIATSAEGGSALRPPLDIDKAIDLWREANHCTDSNCPRPIIVASEGGASRAAYVVASTLGLFMDFSCDPKGQPVVDGQLRLLPCEHPGTPEFANRVFAISGVSGGSLGAAIFSAVLQAHQKAGSPAGAPCQLPDDKRPDGFWIRSGKPQGWRDCMQVILAEDFLSPAIIGLAFRDMLPFLGFSDRAALLEDAWVKAFEKFIPDKANTGAWGMAATFDSLAPEKPEAWRPLLVLNGTSVATGNRILTSHLAFHSGNQLVFTDAYDFREMFARGAADSTPRTVSLATAVTNSARFPVISPQGVLMESRQDTLDRVVDGGYFENYGITTAQEIAMAVKKSALRPGVKVPDPLILLITNDPITSEDVERLAYGQLAPPMPDKQNEHWFSWLSSPLFALYNTRSSRGDLAAIRTGQFSQLGGEVAHLSVYQEPADAKEGEKQTACERYKYTEVSMSWWLSKPVQDYLDRQFFDTVFSCGKQQKILKQLCETLGDPLMKRCNDAINAFERPRASK